MLQRLAAESNQYIGTEMQLQCSLNGPLSLANLDCDKTTLKGYKIFECMNVYTSVPTQ